MEALNHNWIKRGLPEELRNKIVVAQVSYSKEKDKIKTGRGDKVGQGKREEIRMGIGK